MIIDTNNGSNSSEDITLTTPSRKRSKRQGKEKSKKSRIEEIPIENTENMDVTNEQPQEFVQETPESPVFIPTLSSPESDTPEATVDTPIQSHANVDLVTFSVLNSTNVSRLRQERDRLQFAGLRKRHSLLHQLDRSTWPVLFMVCLFSYRADSYSFQRLD